MLFDVRNMLYAPILKWKLGEVQALGSLNAKFQERVLPLFVVPPATDFDWDLLRSLTAAEHIKHFGRRLISHWGSRAVFVDVSQLDSASLKAELGAHPLTALLERARTAGANAFPCVSLASPPDCIGAARDFLRRNPHALWCFRFRLAEFDAPDIAGRIRSMIDRLESNVSRGVLILDAGPIEMFDEGLVDILIERINEFPNLLAWSGVFLSSAGFPRKRKIAVGQIGAFRRCDLELFQALEARASEMIRFPAYSDYAAEYPSKFSKGGGGAAVAHLRFTTPSQFLVSQGPTTKGNGFGAIKAVAERLVGEATFRLAPQSNGRDYIAELAAGRCKGNPSRWRWAATDHHFYQVLFERFTRNGLALPSQEVVTNSQLQLV